MPNTHIPLGSIAFKESNILVCIQSQWISISHTEKVWRRKTFNCGVCIKESTESGLQDDYYGILQEIIHVEYLREPLKQCMLFRCDWFDNTPRRTRCPKLCPFVEVNGTQRYRKYDQFIFASSATQVVYMKYLNGIRDKSNWWVVILKLVIASAQCSCS